MLEKPTVRKRVAEYLVEQLYRQRGRRGGDPGGAAGARRALAGPAAGGVRWFVERAAKEVLSRPRARQAWERANPTAHELLLEMLEGGGPIVAMTGVVAVDLNGLLDELRARTGVGGGVAARLTADAAEVTVHRRAERVVTAQIPLVDPPVGLAWCVAAPYAGTTARAADTNSSWSRAGRAASPSRAACIRCRA
jgi:hypothetical protein